MATVITNTSISADDITIDSDQLTFDTTNDRVGIGTATPLHKMHVVNSAVHEARIGNTDGGHTFISQTNNNSNAFEIYDMHGSNTTRNAFAVATNLSGSKTNLLNVREDGEVQLVNGQNLNGQGSIIQTKINTVNTQASGNPVNTWTEIHSNYRIQIQPKYSNSQILGTYHIPMNPTGSTNILMAIAPWVSTDGGTTKTMLGDGIANGSRFNMVTSWFRSNNGFDLNDMQNHVVHFKHTPGTTNTLTYGWYFRSEGGNTTYFNHSQGNNNTWGWVATQYLELREYRP